MARMGTGGRKLLTMRAVDPLVVKVRMRGACSRRTASTVAPAMARSVGVFPSSSGSMGMS